MKPILTAGATFPRGRGPGLRAAALLAVLAGPALAQQDAPAAKPLLLELNGAVTTKDGGCQLTLVATNALPTGLTRAAWQVAIFDRAGAVQGLPILDFGALLAGKTKVAQFALPGQGCDRIGRIVVNDVAECLAEDGSDQRMACLTGLDAQNRSEIEFGL